MVDSWGMRSAASVIEREIRAVAEGEPIALGELFPHIRLVRRDFARYLVIRCSELEEVTRTPNGVRSTKTAYVVTDQTVRVLRPDDDAHLLAQVDAALGLGLGAQGCRSILENRERQEQSAIRQKVATTESVESKVLALVGEEALRAGLPAGLVEADERRTGKQADATRVAGLALSSHGEGVLSHHRKDIAKRLEGSPHSFNGATKTRQFVTELGLPETFAGVEAPFLLETEEVDGPSEYPSLHTYQERVAGAMAEVLMEYVQACHAATADGCR